MNLNSGCSKFAWKFSDSKISSLRKKNNNNNKKKKTRKITETLPFLPHSSQALRAAAEFGAATTKILGAGGWSRSVPALWQPQGPVGTLSEGQKVLCQLQMGQIMPVKPLQYL